MCPTLGRFWDCYLTVRNFLILTIKILHIENEDGKAELESKKETDQPLTFKEILYDIMRVKNGKEWDGQLNGI